MTMLQLFYTKYLQVALYYQKSMNIYALQMRRLLATFLIYSILTVGKKEVIKQCFPSMALE